MNVIFTVRFIRITFWKQAVIHSNFYSTSFRNELIRQHYQNLHERLNRFFTNLDNFVAAVVK